MILCIQNRDEHDATVAERLEVSHIIIFLLDEFKVTMHDFADRISQFCPSDKSSADVTISE